MRAQVVLTTVESKKLIAKGILQMEKVKKALKDGLVAIHPSSTTYFIKEELDCPLPSKVWVCGWILPKGTCGSGQVLEHYKKEGRWKDILDFPHTWVFKKGQIQTGMKLGEIIQQMDVDDVYIKTGNALDPQGNVGVLLGRQDGGTISRVVGAARGRGFEIILGIGLEKLIPVSIREASKEAGAKRMDYAMGIPVGLIPIDGTTVTEIQAIRMLTGADAIPIAAGGLGGAEGSLSLIIKGEEEEVRKGIDLVKSVKGAKLPDLNIFECSECAHPTCHLGGQVYKV